MEINILGIESSCDDTSAAVVSGGVLLSNVIASDISAVAFTRGPGLLGSLIVGCSFAKGFALAGGIPMIEVNHLQGHVLSQFVHEKDKPKEDPQFPFLTLLVSGGHTQIIKVKDYFDMEIIGTTIDDAAGEAFDKCAKVMGLGYPGGPVIDKHAHQGNHDAFLYTLRDRMKDEPDFIDTHLDDLCASLQYTIVSILIEKLGKAVKETGIRQITIGGGVAANSELRDTLTETAKRKGWKVFIPERKFTTDNAAMIAGAGYYKYLKGEFASMDLAPDARLKF